MDDHKIRVKKKISMNSKLKCQTLIILALGMVLACFYGYHINSLHATLWELGDEAGYLWNAAYFTGTDWDSFAGIYAYYGYGYSLLLVPLFWIADSGIQLVNWAYIINVICVLGMYLVLIRLLREISKKSDALSIPIIAFISCLTPYIVSNTLKVLCEVFLSFWYSLLVLLLYLYLSEKKKKYVVFLGIGTAFIFFIHTRAVVVVGTLVLVLLLDIVKSKEKAVKYFIFFMIIMGGTFAVLYVIKSRILDYMVEAMQIIGSDANVGNIVTMSNLLDCLKWFNPVIFSCDFCAKVFYTTYATGGVLIPGFLCMGKRVFMFLKSKDYDNRERAVSVVVIFVMSSYIFTLAALVYRGYGSDFRYAIYGRYFEHMLPVILSICIYFFTEHSENLSKKELFMCMVFVVCIGIVTRIWSVSNLPNQSILVDTNRLAAFSKSITINHNLSAVIEFLILECVLYLFCYTAFDRKKYAKWVVLSIIFITLWINDRVCLDEIHAIHNRKVTDTEIAEYLINNSDSNNIYMIDDDSYWYPYFYSKMQIYLKDDRLYVINPEQSENIEAGAYVMVYSTTDLNNSVLSEYHLLMKGSTFFLYQK